MTKIALVTGASRGLGLETAPASVEAAAARVGERHGRLDVLVNNAGILPEATEARDNGPVDVPGLQGGAQRVHDRASSTAPGRVAW